MSQIRSGASVRARLTATFSWAARNTLTTLWLPSGATALIPPTITIRGEAERHRNGRAWRTRSDTWTGSATRRYRAVCPRVNAGSFAVLAPRQDLSVRLKVRLDLSAHREDFSSNSPKWGTDVKEDGDEI